VGEATENGSPQRDKLFFEGGGDEKYYLKWGQNNRRVRGRRVGRGDWMAHRYGTSTNASGRLKVLTAVTTRSIVFWDLTLCSFCRSPPTFRRNALAPIFRDPEDGGNKFLRNVGGGKPDYTALHPRRQ
jgi:hypothetical protein